MPLRRHFGLLGDGGAGRSEQLAGFDPLPSEPHDRRDFGCHEPWRMLRLPHLDQALADTRDLLAAVTGACPRP